MLICNTFYILRLVPTHYVFNFWSIKFDFIFNFNADLQYILILVY